MRLRPDNVTLLGDGLDHPECVCLGPPEQDGGALYAGGEAGQIYRITTDGRTQVVGSTGGFVLGVAIDGDGCVHACDLKRQVVVRVDPRGNITVRSRGTTDRPLRVPNFGVFDPAGNYYVSDSGDYWSQTGDGCLFVIRPDGRTELFHPGPLRFPNGLAIDPTGEWLYVVLSTAPAIARLPLQGKADLEITHRLPDGVVPDGIAFTRDGRLVIGCYKPDAIYLGESDGLVRLLHDDPTGELLSRPTNIALRDGRLYAANLGGWHITAMASDLPAAPLHQPRLS